MQINLAGQEKVYRKNKGLLTALHLDLWLILGILALIFISSLVVFSSSGGDLEVTLRHLSRVGVAFVIMIVFAQVPPIYLKVISPWVFALALILLVAVVFFGEIGKGAQRWLDFGFFLFQPSELMKLALPMMLARLYAQDHLPPPGHKMFLGLILVGLSAGLIIVQPDLGTSILIAMSGLFILFFAGLSWKAIASATAVLMASAPVVWNFYMYEYQKQRVLTFLNPESDPLDSGYHIIQSKIAIGSGGIEGKGFMGSSQAHLDFLPESTTDFIFSVLAEEFGLIGVIVLLIIYSLVIARGLYISSQAQDNFTRLLSASLTMTLFIYVLVNIGMVSGLLPVVGLPLPLMSYGGSALVTLMISFGILMSIHTHKKMLST